MHGQWHVAPLVLVPSGYTSDERGRYFEHVVAELLQKQRYEVTERVRYTGMEIDVLADQKDTRERAYAECKFEREPFGAEVVDKLLGKGLRHNVDIVYLFSVSEPGKEAKGAIDELRRSTATRPRFAFVGPDAIVDTFADLYRMDAAASLPKGGSLGAVHLVIAPELPPFWALEELGDGLPRRCLIVSHEPANLKANLRTVRSLFKENGVMTGLPVSFWGDSSVGSAAAPSSSTMVETVATVVAADSLVDYRPCRPSDFVGRDELQKDVWAFLERVVARQTDSRILALSGPSGFGKSSTVVKLADRFRNARWKKRFYLHPVDSRAAEGPLFVPAAVKAALDAAIAVGLVEVGASGVRIHSSEAVLDSPDVVACMDSLEKSERVLVLFFDQFEEMLYKPELQPVFEAFRRLAYEVNARQGNLVLGFSWRTGITLPDGNPAYHVWHSLSDMRVNLQVGIFAAKESSKLVTLFQQALGQTLLPPLRRRLIEQAQGIPWLLKKLCIHVYREIIRGATQYELLERRLNIEALFQEDLHLVSSEAEQACLRFIAKNSPVALDEVTERFGDVPLNALYESRLIVRVGSKYAVYWDVFRDYLNDGEPPPIPWTYVPGVSVSMAMRGFRAIQQEQNMDLERLAQALGYATNTTVNIVSDLQNLALATRTPTGKYLPHPQLQNADAVEVASYLHELFEDHVATRAIRSAFREGQRLSMPQFHSAVQRAYLPAGVRPEYARRYARKLGPWLRFAGYLEKQQNALRLPDTATGRDFGLYVERRAGGREGERLFLGAAPAHRVVELARELSSSGALSRAATLTSGVRNAAEDLMGLRLARWDAKTLVPLGALAGRRVRSMERCRQVLAEAASRSPFIGAARAALAQAPGMNAQELGAHLGVALGRAWSPASQLRYGGSAKRWVEFATHASRE